jgi:hypothetical protein
VTIFGQHTVSELRELLKAKETQINDVQAAFDAFSPQWKKQDQPSWSAWSVDWNNFGQRFMSARAKANLVLLRPLSGVADTTIPAESEYQGILRALTAKEGTFTDTDFQGLHNRLVAAQKKPIDFSNTPQPTAGDADLQLRNALAPVDVIAQAKNALNNPTTGKPSALKIALGVAIASALGYTAYEASKPIRKFLPIP